MKGKKSAPYIVIGICFLAGLAVLLYPSVSSWYNGRFQIEAVVGYDRAMERLTEEALAAELARARAYNEALASLPLGDPFAYEGSGALPEGYASILDAGSGIMGAIEIPKIDVSLPIYHGTGAQTLEKGAGHMEMTAFPIGGAGSHAVLTGHTGLPDARLFTDLTELAVGDAFTIRIGGETLAYRVDRIAVVLPSDTTALRPIEGEDYVSLVTCTPYGVNSHRLLVRGKRVSYAEPEQAGQPAVAGEAAERRWRLDFIIPYLALGIAALVFLAAWLRRQARKRREGR